MITFKDYYAWTRTFIKSELNWNYFNYMHKIPKNYQFYIKNLWQKGVFT